MDPRCVDAHEACGPHNNRIRHSSSPFQATWTNVQAGTYSLTAVATDNSNATTTSAAVTITVTAGGGSTLPGGWTNSDVGATGAAGSALVLERDLHRDRRGCRRLGHRRRAAVRSIARSRRSGT